MASNPFAEAFSQGRMFRLREESAGYLSCKGEGYDKTGLQRGVPEAQDEDRLWLVTALFPDGSFKLANVLFGLSLCAHYRLMRDPCLFCHLQSSSDDQIWRCEPVQPSQGAAIFRLRNSHVKTWGPTCRWRLVPAGLVSESATLQARARAKAQAPQPAQPEGSISVGAALTAGAAVAAVVEAAVVAVAGKRENDGRRDLHGARPQAATQRGRPPQEEDATADRMGRALGSLVGLGVAAAAAHGWRLYGQKVRLLGLATSPHLNGLQGRLGRLEESGRWLVLLDNGQAALVLPANFERVGDVAEAEASPTPTPTPPPPAPMQPQGVQMERLAARVEEVAEEARHGPLNSALEWQGMLTEICMALDSLDLGGDAGLRRALLARVREVSGQIEAREGAVSESLAACAATVAELEVEIEGAASPRGRHQAERQSCRDRLSAVGSALDALDCASEAQRSERRRIVRKMVALEAALAGGASASTLELQRDADETPEGRDIEATMNALAAMPMPSAQKRAGLSTVRTLLSNVVDHPENEKYRRVRKSNPKVQKLLFPQCHELLRLAGFADDGDAFVYVGESPGPQLHVVLVFLGAVLESLPHAGDGPDGAAEQLGASESCPSRRQDVMEVAGDVLVSALPAEKVREGLRTVCLLLSRVKTQPDAQGRVQVPSSLTALADFPLGIDLLRCAGFEDWEDSLLYRGIPRGESPRVEMVHDVALALLQSSVDEVDVEGLSQGSPSASAAAEVAPQGSSYEQGGSGRHKGRADRFAGRRAVLERRRAEQRAASADALQVPFAPQPRGTAQASAGAQQVPLHSIRFSQSSIASTFQNGRSVEETVQQLRSGALRVEDLPTIRVVEHMNLLWSLDNRRLHCMKKAFPERSHPDKLVTVQLEALSSRRVRDEFLKKFTTGTMVVQRGG